MRNVCSAIAHRYKTIGWKILNFSQLLLPPAVYCRKCAKGKFEGRFDQLWQADGAIIIWCNGMEGVFSFEGSEKGPV